MNTDVLLFDAEVQVRFGPVCHRFPRTALGVMRAVEYVMTFGKPITFWSDARQLAGISAFLAEAEVFS
ncbi:hypothetical protein GKIL_2586 [Gloeobacter kilaueensis JS1]|uniref:Uncharacterized protein n=2 Tax=Gloeobacter TaxID=33071 RepID=U5QIQ0_GLOK1|nr:hypothetical protein GKIL_2586 [Gloeobacter kilaueensis JS1]